MTLDDTLSEIEKQWPLELKEAQPASDTKRPMEVFEYTEAAYLSDQRDARALPDHVLLLSAMTLHANIAPTARDVQLDVIFYNEVLHRLALVDRLLNHCDKESGECSGCGRIVCPFSDELHFHHDGCPSCSCEESVPSSDADSVSDVTESDNASRVSSPKSSLSPEIVIPALCKAVRESRRRYLVEVGPDSYEHKEFDAFIASILEKKDA